jgi:hypothetical protein
MSNMSPEGIAHSVRRAHDAYVAAILAFRREPSREARQRLDAAAIRHDDLMMVLFNPNEIYVAPKPKGRRPSAENSVAVDI